MQVKLNRLTGVCLLAFLCCCACQKGQGPSIAWYWWKTVYAPDSAELAYFSATGAKQLGVRLFDVDTSARYPFPSPKGILQQKQAWPDSVKVVPVVYITRAALLQPGSLDSLAARIARLVGSLMGKSNWTEIQWDHDWTGSTRANYFTLLRLLKQQAIFNNKTFTATIRLHQLRQTQPGLMPPVRKGLLMVYNMGHLTQAGNTNSILDEAVWKSYQSALKKYPLPLDWAVPVFAWAVQFRQNRFVAILNGVRAKEVIASGLVDALPNGQYRCRKAGFLAGFGVQAGDVLRLEGTDAVILEKIVRILRHERNDIQPTLYFFDWQKKHIPYFSSYDIQRISQAH